MSIFKETFKDYVKAQLSVREKVVSRGNPKEGLAFNQRRTPSANVTLQGGNVITLDAGAFHSYTTEKQCTIRMTSIVDYVEDVGLEIGVDGNMSTFDSLKGSSLSQNFILQGGVLSDFARNADGERKTRRVTTPRAGFRRPGLATNLSYGDGAIVSNATSDGYGIVPMPGIIDANIRTKTAYGSLREAKVNFVCHNQRQLEILEMLYMRPGYPVLIEWGWTPHINNNGNITRTLELVEDDLGDILYTNEITQDAVFRSIDKLKSNQSGNYDGMLGYIKNFGFEARADGGFDCYTELISVGEVLDSLKTNRFDQIATSPDRRDHNGLSGLLNLITPSGDSLTEGIEADSLADFLIQGITKNVVIPLIEGLGIEDHPEQLKDYLFTLRPPADAEGIQSTILTFIRWDALCLFLNKQFVPFDEKGNQITQITPDRLITNKGETIVDNLLFAAYTEGEKLTDISCDINVCILPNQFQFHERELQDSPSVENWNPFHNAPNLLDVIYKGKTITSDNYPLLDDNTKNRRIGNIYLNTKMVGDIINNNKDNPKYTVGNLVRDIWDRINNVCPNHNFQLVDDKTSSHVYMVDFPVSDAELPPKDELYKLTPLSNDNTLRDFNFESEVPNALAATIAIQAQDPRNIEDIDSVTWAAFNMSIKNRLVSIDTTPYIAKVLNNVNKERDIKIEEMNILWKDISSYIRDFLRIVENPQFPGENSKILANITGKVKQYQTLQEYIKLADKTSIPTTIIPLSFNASLEGISGIVIGNVFQITQDRLPKAYKKANVGFIVFGEEQIITAGQDWITKIDGMVTLLSDGKKPIPKGNKPLDEEIALIVEEGLVDSIRTTTEQEDIPQGMEEVGEGDKVYLKHIKFKNKPTVETKPNSLFGGLTYVRSTSNIDNSQGFILNPFSTNDNVVGAFDSTADAGIELGRVVEIKKINYGGNLIRVKSDYYKGNPETARIVTEGGLDPQAWPKVDGNSGVMKYDRISVDIGGGKYVCKARDPFNGFPGTGDYEVTVPLNEVIHTAQVWYKILFGPEASEAFHNGVVYDSYNNDIILKGADDQLPEGSRLLSTEYWMRIDVLAPTTEKAGVMEIVKNTNSNPVEPISTQPNEKLIETYIGYDIYLIGGYYELKVDTVSPYGYSTSVEAGDAFSSLELIKEAIDEDLSY